MPEGGSKINWTWILVGGAAVVVVLVLVMKSGSTTNAPTNSTPQTTNTSPTSNTGTPLGDNNSLFGFTDPATGIQWILNSATEAMVALPNGSGMIPTYTAGTTLLPSTSVVPMNIGGPTAYGSALSNWQSFMGYTNN